MQKEDFAEAFKEAKQNSPKRNFNQTVDLVINLKNLDMKKAESNLDQYISLHFKRGKKVKVCALVGPELKDAAKEACDNVIEAHDFAKYKDKAAIKKLANEYDFFIAQANVMPQIATAFGRIFGPRGKMPNPKAGCVVPPNANLQQLYDRLQYTVRVQTKNAPSVKCPVGTQDMKDEEVADNALVVYNSVMHALPNEEQNIKNASLKLTMGKPAQVVNKQKVEVTAEK